MKRRRAVLASVVGSVAATALLAAPAPASQPDGSPLYVSPEGDDSNPGSEDEPFRTIQKAADVAVAGSTVHVAPGAYPGDVDLSTAGTAGGWIRYVSETRHAATITGLVSVNAEYVRLAGFDITGPEERDGLLVTASNTVVEHNRFHDIHKFEPNSNGGSGLTVYTDDYGPLENVVVNGNHVFDIGLSDDDSQLVQGIYISIPCQGCRVVNNLVHQIADFGIHAYHEPEHWLVANNTVFDNGRGILTGPSFTVINNISYDNQDSDYDVRGEARISHNLSFGSGSEELPGVTVADPLFVDYRPDGSGDYHLTADSPGLDGGTADGAPTRDLEGRKRPQGGGYDIGAYEQ